MFKKFVLIFVFVVIFYPSHRVFAEVVINEIMYDLEGSDTDKEWIEIYNNGSEAVTIKGGTAGEDSWRIYQKSATGTENNRTLTTEAYQGSMSLEPLEYAIVAYNGVDFKSSYPSYTGKIFISSAMSLTNTSGTLGLRLGSGGVLWSLVTYDSGMGGNGDGKSLQRTVSGWQAGVPTPGAVNQTTGSEPDEPENQEEEWSQVSNTTETPKTISQNLKINLKIIGGSTQIAGLPIFFDAKVFSPEGASLFYGDYFWNFGDGGAKEQKVNYSNKFSYTYFYPGEYLVSLEYFSNIHTEFPDAVQKVLVKILPPDLSISAVGPAEDFFIEIANNSAENLDVSKWTLSSGNKNFVLPKNTRINAGKKILIPPTISEFNFSDRENLVLLNPVGKKIFTYVSEVTPPVSVPAKPAVRGARTDASSTSGALSKERSYVPEDLVAINPFGEEFYQAQDANAQDLSLASNVLTSDATNKDSRTPYLMILFLLIVLGAGGSLVYFIRRRKMVKNEEDDFDILSE